MTRHNTLCGLDRETNDALHQFFGTPKHAFRILTLGHPAGVPFDKFMRLWGGFTTTPLYANIVRDSLTAWREHLTYLTRERLTPESFVLPLDDAQRIAFNADDEAEVALPKQDLDPELRALFNKENGR